MQFPEDYPTAPLIVELTSPSLPQPFLRKLTKKAEEAARSCSPTATDAAGVENPTRVDSSTNSEKAYGSDGGGSRGAGRAVAALKVVKDAVDKNKLLPCWKELRQAATLVTTR